MLLLLIIELAFSQSINLLESLNQSDWIIYSDNQYNPLFFWPHEQCCTPPKLQIIKADQSINYTNNVIITLIGYILNSYKGNKDYKGYNTNFTFVSEKQLNVSNKCKQNKAAIKEELNESGLVYIELMVQNTFTKQIEKLIFHYWFYCQYSDNIYKQKINYDLSMQLVIMLGFISVWIFAQSYKIRSIIIQLPNPNKYRFIKYIFAIQTFKKTEEKLYFQGFIVTWITFFIYIAGAGIFYILVHDYSNWYEFILIICMIATFFLNWFFMNEIFFYFPASWKCQYRLCKFITISDCLSLVWSTLVVYLYLRLYQPWYLSTIIAFCFTGATTRLFKILSLKDVTIFYVLIILYDIYIYEIFFQQRGINYQVEMLRYSNYPVLFEIPQMKSQLYKLCDWLSVSNLFTPCLLLGYLYRFCINKNSKAYFYIGLIGFFLGLIVWALIAFSVGLKGVQLAQSFIVLPIITLSVILWSIRQGEFWKLWNGQFFDNSLLNKFQAEYSQNQIIEFQSSLKNQTIELIDSLVQETQINEIQQQNKQDI